MALREQQPKAVARQRDQDVKQEEARQHAACSAWIRQHGAPGTLPGGSLHEDGMNG